MPIASSFAFHFSCISLSTVARQASQPLRAVSNVRVSPDEVAAFEFRVVARHLGDVEAREIERAELEQPQHGVVRNADLVVGRGIRR